MCLASIFSILENDDDDDDDYDKNVTRGPHSCHLLKCSLNTLANYFVYDGDTTSFCVVFEQRLLLLLLLLLFLMMMMMMTVVVVGDFVYDSTLYLRNTCEKLDE